ncbi:MAG: hypothetical protein WKF40_07455 [Thermoleophilaceae bacterium]
MDVPMFVWMFVVLKVPLIAAIWLIWWAVREPEPATDEDQDSGGSDRRHRPGSRHPQPPRRGGPHASPVPAPARVRTVVKGRRTSRS